MYVFLIVNWGRLRNKKSSLVFKTKTTIHNNWLIGIKKIHFLLKNWDLSNINVECI